MAPGWKVWLFTVISGVIATLISIYVSISMAEENAAAQIQAARDAGRAQQAAACDLFRRILAAYEETPPTTKAGRNVVEAWQYQYDVTGCTPKR